MNKRYMYTEIKCVGIVCYYEGELSENHKSAKTIHYEYLRFSFDSPLYLVQGCFALLSLFQKYKIKMSHIKLQFLVVCMYGRGTWSLI